MMLIPAGPRLGSKGVFVDGVTLQWDDDDGASQEELQALQQRTDIPSVRNKLLYKNMSFSLTDGNVLGVVGPNGSGKTTFLRMMTGDLKPTQGNIEFGATVKIGYNKQTRESLKSDATVWREIVGDLETIDLGNGHHMAARKYVSQFNFRGDAQNKKVAMLSGGERNRVQLAKSMRDGCNVMLLDEPTNDLDVDTLRSLEEALAETAGAAVIVSHDRWFLDRVCTHILEIKGDKEGGWVFFEGNYTEYEKHRLRELNYERTEDGKKKMTKAEMEASEKVDAPFKQLKY
jgi:ATPase subunit of ABC transporter with duplicated ATPase domains